MTPTRTRPDRRCPSRSGTAARRGELVVPQLPGLRSALLRARTGLPGVPVARTGDYEPSAGRGTVYSVTVVHRAPGPGFDAPFALAVIDLDDGAHHAVPRGRR